MRPPAQAVAAAAAATASARQRHGQHHQHHQQHAHGPVRAPQLVTSSSYHGQLRLASPGDSPVLERSHAYFQDPPSDKLSAASLIPPPADAANSFSLPSPALDADVEAQSHSASSYSTDDGQVTPLHSYRTFRLSHLLCDLPITLFILLGFALLEVYGWPAASDHYPHRMHWDALLMGSIACLASEAIHPRLFRFVSISRSSITHSLFPITLLQSAPIQLLAHTAVRDALRLFALSFVLHHHSSLSTRQDKMNAVMASAAIRPPKGFFKTYAVGLGFAAADTIRRTLKLLNDTSLYEEVLMRPEDDAWLVGEERLDVSQDSHKLSHAEGNPPAIPSHSRPDSHVQDAPVSLMDTDNLDLGTEHQSPHRRDTEAQISRLNGTGEYTDDEQSEASRSFGLSEEEIDATIRQRKRAEIVENFGCELYEIPIVVVAVWRLDATLLNLALTLFMAIPFQSTEINHHHGSLPVWLPLLPTFIGVVFVHWLISLVWTLGIRLHDQTWMNDESRLPAISYGTLVLVLATFFASLAAWGVIV